MAVADLKVAGNHEEGSDKGDKVFSEPATAEDGKSVIRMKITETHHIEFHKILIE
jgi:hypothetical protein